MSFDSPQAVIRFYGETINAHDFDQLLPCLSRDVLFWFSSGTHSGLDAARGAFEATWGRIVDERYWLEDLIWLCEDSTSASCVYRFRWRGLVDGVLAEGKGRGTTVLRRESSGWVIVHEHLSAEPA